MLLEFCLGFGFFLRGALFPARIASPHYIYQYLSSVTCLAFLSLIRILLAEAIYYCCRGVNQDYYDSTSPVVVSVHTNVMDNQYLTQLAIKVERKRTMLGKRCYLLGTTFQTFGEGRRF